MANGSLWIKSYFSVEPWFFNVEGITPEQHGCPNQPFFHPSATTK
jgi:hypothetical protein